MCHSMLRSEYAWIITSKRANQGATNTIVTCVVCILNYCGFYPIYNSDEHWKMPRKLSYAQQKPEVAVVDRNCAGCVQGK